MLRVVAICAVVLACHLIAAADSDITDDGYLTNETLVEETTTVQSKIEPKSEDDEADHNGQDVCLRPPDIDGIISPDIENEEYLVGTVIRYQCKFGYVSRSSGSLLSICSKDSHSGKVEWTHPNTTCNPRSCGDPGYVENGRRVGNLFTFPNKVEFECQVGYKLQGLKDRYCQATGEWSGTLPKCVPIYCPVPSNPKNGQVFYFSLDYGTELKYECEKGFMLQNHQPRICNEDGFWSNDEPECLEISCGMPVAPEHGSVQLYDELPKVGTLVFYSCDDGATLVGASTSKCLSSGDWTFDPPKCLRSCIVPEIQDGELGRNQWKNRYRQDFISLRAGESVKHHEILTLRCKDGYSPGNRSAGTSQEVECNDGSWSQHLRCHPMVCNGEPPPVENGWPQISSRMHGRSIWYRCDPGYERAKTGKVVCQYGKWEGPTPVCADYKCYMKDLQHPGLVKPRRDFIDHNQHFDLVCDEAYKVASWKKRVICFEGKWDITKDPCVIKICEEDPPQINSGKTRDFTRVNGSVVYYECDDGYELEGDSTVHCAFGAWIGQPPICKLLENLSTETAIENTDANTKSLEPTSDSLQPEECFCTYDFRQDFVGAHWKNREIQSYDRILKGEKILIVCRYNGMDIIWPNGLRVFGSMELVCDTCQDWRMQDLPQCEQQVTGDSYIIYDTSLKLMPGGVIEVSESERISLTCVNPWTSPKWNVTRTNRISFQSNPVSPMQTGYFREDLIINKMEYEHIGRHECFAMHRGKLRPTIIDLKIAGYKEIFCPELSTETNQGSFEITYSNQRKVQSTAHYKCKDPLKKIVGPSGRICRENGKWSRSFPACEAICEEDPPQINSGKTRDFSRVNGSVVYYECDDGYELEGDSTVHCAFGAWIGQPPICKLSVENLSTETAIENTDANTKSLEPTSDSLQPEECFCTYDFRQDFVGAHWKNREIQSYDRILKGEKILIVCRYNGMDIIWPNGLRVFGSMELVCDTCQDWRMQDLPQCEQQVTGDSYIIYDTSLKLIPGGVIEVSESERISLTCVNPWTSPKWNVTRTNRISFQSNPVSPMQTGYFREDLIINKMEYEHIGRHECFAMHGGKLRPTVIDLKIAGYKEIFCPELSTETNQGSFEITYSNQRKVQSTAHYKCKDPLKKIVGTSERICRENGKWSRSFPACEDIRCPLLNENNVFLISYSSSSRKVNSVAYYSCESIYQRLIGSSNRTCLHSGQWSGTNPYCEDITCPEFLTYNGLSVTYSKSRRIGSIASFSCLNHATLIGSSTAACLYNGKWSHPKPSCELLEIHCPKIDGKGVFTIKYSNGRKVNSTAQFFCKAPSKKVAGCNFMTCQENGEWSGDFPTCVDYVTCDSFAALPNLKVFYTDGGRVGSVASFQCLAPTYLVGNSSATCLSNGTWSYYLPTCAAPNCSVGDLYMSLSESLHPNLENLTGEFVTPGSEMPLMCEEHLVLTGSSKAVCNVLGKWESTDAQCIPACRVNKDESSLLIVEPVKDYYRFGEFIILSCPPGQKLTTEVERMMCLGRTWSDTLPDCAETTETDSSGLTETAIKSG